MNKIKKQMNTLEQLKAACKALNINSELRLEEIDASDRI